MSGKAGKMMPEVKALKIIAHLMMPQIQQIRTAKDQKRRSIFVELIQTERNFVDSLVALDEVYYRPLDQSINTKKPLIDATTLAALFGNIDQIRDVHQNELLKAMDEILPFIKQPNTPKEKYLYLATKFNEIIPRLESLYRSYLSTNENTDNLVEKLKKDNKQFAKFLSASLFNPKSKCRSIEDFLILPVQRIAGYRCLFERILKYFPESEEELHKTYKDLMERMVKLGAAMNSDKAGAEDQEKLLNLAEAITKKPPFLIIMKPGRKLLGHVNIEYLDDETGEKKAAGKAYICNDILLLTTEVKGGFFSGMKTVYEDVVPLSQIRFSAIPFDSLADIGLQMKMDTREFNLCMPFEKKDKKGKHRASAARKRDKFIHVVKKQKKHIKNRVKKQSANGALHMQNVLNEIVQLYKEPTPLKSRSEVLSSL